MEESVLFERKKIHLCSPSNVVSYSFEWTIENFSFYEALEDTYEKLSSPLLRTEDKNYSWKLDLYLNGSSKSFVGYISIYLVNESQKKDFFTKATLSLLNCPSIQKRDLVISRTAENWGYGKFVSREELFKDPGLISTDSLTILCEIKILEIGSKQSCVEFKTKKMTTLSRDLTHLLKNKDSSDITLLVGEKEFKVHKLILAARSPVFAAMFSHDLEEQQSNIVRIEDALPTIMAEVIRYIYTDEFPKMKEFAEEVLPVADKYALHGLKYMCAEELYSQLSASNAARLLLLADMHNATSLKETIINFIVMNSRTVVATPSWIEMEGNKHPLVTDVALAILTKLHLH